MASGASRIYPTTGIINLRDYGGYRLSSGSVLRTSVLLRSGQHCDATDEDLELVDQLGIVKFVDLRSLHERSSRPCRRSARFRSDQLVFHPYELTRAPHEHASGGSVDEVESRLEVLYRLIPFSPHMREAYRLYFEALASANGPVVVHCAAGKDRTGVAVALLLSLAGVHWDEVVEDFVLTNMAGSYDAREKAFGENFRHGMGAGMSDAVVRAALDVRPSYLESCFDEIETRMGSLSAYFTEFLNVSPGIRETIVRNITA